MKNFGWWIFENIPLGILAPHFFGWLIGSKPVRIEIEKGISIRVSENVKPKTINALHEMMILVAKNHMQDIDKNK